MYRPEGCDSSHYTQHREGERETEREPSVCSVYLPQQQAVCALMSDIVF